MRSQLDRLLRLSGDVAATLPILPSVREHVASALETGRALSRIAGDTEALPSVREDMGRVSEATSVLAAMDRRIATIEEAMPVLVEVQRHLSHLPETMGRLDEGVDHLSTVLEEMLASLGELGTSVDALHESVGPVSRLASRMPGQRRAAKPEAISRLRRIASAGSAPGA